MRHRVVYQRRQINFPLIFSNGSFKKSIISFSQEFFQSNEVIKEYQTILNDRQHAPKSNGICSTF